MNVKKTIKFYLYIFFISKIFSEENNIINPKKDLKFFSILILKY